MTSNILRVFSSFLAAKTLKRSKCWKHTSSCPSVRRRLFRPCLEQLEERQLLNGVTFFDGTFNNSDWTASKILDTTPGQAASFVTGQVLTGGNLGPYRQTTQTYPGPGSIVVGDLQTLSTYNPSTQGAVSSIDFSFDMDFISLVPGISNAVAYGPLLYQGGNYYSGGFDQILSSSLGSWQHFNNLTLTASQFSRFGSGPGPSNPDFSATGSPFQVGYYTSNGTGGTGTGQTVSGIDNWSVTIHGPTADLVVNRVSTTNPSEVSVNYTVSNSDSVPFNIGIYRSATPNYDPSAAVNVGTIDLSEPDKLKIGPHDAQLTTESGLPNKWLQPDPLHPYVLAVADPNNQTGETDSAHNTASFHVYVIGAVVPGFGETDPSTPPAWALEMANALQRDPNMIGFDKVFAFGWNSTSPEHSLIVDAGTELSSEIKGIGRSAFRHLEPNDVIDVTLIGHSRGGVVISEAMRFLDNGVIPQLRHGYKEMFLIDPHPANASLRYGVNASVAPGALGEAAESLNIAFELKVYDPEVRIPSDVNLAEEWYQHTHWYLLNPFTTGGEGILNLWGLDPQLITIESPRTTLFKSTNLTDMPYNGGFIGHSETHEWFQANIIPELLNPTYSSPG